ncbi:MAG: hypothetical protein FWD28_04545 [Treponema sp.]|nr:hypothetical protein [Treponema sp.]
MIRKAFIFSLLLICFLLSVNHLSGSEITDGNIRLVLHERTGSFSLYHMSNNGTMRYEPLFNNRNPGASFTSISVDGNVFKLGDRQFRPRYERFNGDPSFVFEHLNIEVRQVFKPIKTPNSNIVNGIVITYTVKNNAERDYLTGLKILIDTELGEGRGRVPFITGSRIISDEFLTQGSSGERFWISRGQTVSLMGSILNPLDPNVKLPDFIHFANWRRLNNSRWALRYSQGRSFNNDSAVCYIYEPEKLESGKTLTYSIILSTEDIVWYNSAPVRTVSPANVNPGNTGSGNVSSGINVTEIINEARAEAQRNNANADTYTLIRLQELLNRFIAGDISLSERDLMEIENAIERYR